MEIKKFRTMQKIVRKWQQLRNRSQYSTVNPHPVHWKLTLLPSCFNPTCEEKGRCSCPPRDVPHGFLAVYVGRERKRFVIPAVFLNHPVFRLLLEKAKEEFGFSQKGGLTMPCEALLFERFLCLVGNDDPASRELGIEELETYCFEKYHLKMETVEMDD